MRVGRKRSQPSPLAYAIAEHEKLKGDYEIAKIMYGNAGNGGPDFDTRWAHRIERAATNVEAVRSEWEIGRDPA